MKTFQEAFETVVQVLPEEHMHDPKLRRAAEERAADAVERVRGLADEAHQNAHLNAILESMPDSTCCLHHALHAAFQLGLRVGIEMEKQELPGVEARRAPWPCQCERHVLTMIVRDGQLSAECETCQKPHPKATAAARTLAAARGWTPEQAIADFERMKAEPPKTKTGDSQEPPAVRRRMRNDGGHCGRAKKPTSRYVSIFESPQ